MSITSQINQRLSNYANRVNAGLESVDKQQLQKVLETLEVAYKKDFQYLCVVMVGHLQ